MINNRLNDFDNLDRKGAERSNALMQTSGESDLGAIADHVRLVEHMQRVIQSSAARVNKQQAALPSSELTAFEALLKIELERTTLRNGRSSITHRESVHMSFDTSINGRADSGVHAQHSSATSVDQVARQWQSVVGAKSAATSRPVCVVENQLIIEVAPDTKLSGPEMGRALKALGRADVDRVAIRVVNTIHDRQAQTQSQRQGIRR